VFQNIHLKILGTQKDTYLEFDRVLRIKKSSSFGLEFRTTENDGIIFYIADERNVDFIALLIKDGRVGHNDGHLDIKMDSRQLDIKMEIRQLEDRWKVARPLKETERH
jgi:hypothetical protein